MLWKGPHGPARRRPGGARGDLQTLARSCHTARAALPRPQSQDQTARATRPGPHGQSHTARATQPEPDNQSHTARATLLKLFGVRCSTYPPARAAQAPPAPSPPPSARAAQAPGPPSSGASSFAGPALIRANKTFFFWFGPLFYTAGSTWKRHTLSRVNKISAWPLLSFAEKARDVSPDPPPTPQNFWFSFSEIAPDAPTRMGIKFWGVGVGLEAVGGDC